MNVWFNFSFNKKRIYKMYFGQYRFHIKCKRERNICKYWPPFLVNKCLKLYRFLYGKRLNCSVIALYYLICIMYFVAFCRKNWDQPCTCQPCTCYVIKLLQKNLKGKKKKSNFSFEFCKQIKYCNDKPFQVVKFIWFFYNFVPNKLKKN